MVTETHTSTARSLAAIALVASLASGCGTFVAYPGEARPEQEIATLECYTRYYVVYLGSCGITAVSGKRSDAILPATRAEFEPGRHWFEVAFEGYFGGGGGVSDVCAFELDTQAGHRYRVIAHGLHTTVGLARHGATLYSGTLQIADDAPSGASETRTVAVTCRPFGGALCRAPADCGRPAAGWPAPLCEMRPEHPYGLCVQPAK